MRSLYGGEPPGKLVAPLLAWYEESQRVLPWRENTDAYRVWVSEIMLQQTRVDTVLDYYQRFMERLPDIRALAAVDEETLMKLWEGLGYYSRVKNMQKAARLICEQYHGEFPQAYEDILALPGIGPYTAGAVSSIAFEQPRAAVDGNVLRVITRLTADSRDITDNAFKRAISEALEAVYPAGRCGAFTQSLMELGAIVCVPNGAPRCGECPLQTLCCACQNGTQADYPVKKPKAAKKKQVWSVLLLTCGDHMALRKRSDGGLLGGLWEFPNLAGKVTKQELHDWFTQQGIRLQDTGIEAVQKKCVKKHIFTHIEWEMHCYEIQCENMPDGQPEPLVWVERERLNTEIALPTAFRKLIN